MSFIKSLKWLAGDDDQPVKANRPSFDMGTDHFLRFREQAQYGSSEIPTVIVKEQILESSKIKPYQYKESEQNILYEPQTLDEYTGQEQAKEQIKTAVKIIQQLRPVNILINGWAGCGKTTLARITANMLDANFIYRVPEQLDDVDKLLEVINLIQTTECLTVFILDEIHAINKFPRVANVLLPILQDWQYGDARIRPFVMIGATTDKDRLIKNQSPLVSRFQIQITLDKYTPAELVQIVRKYKEALYSEYPMTDRDLNIIAQNSRGIPREAIALMLKQLVVQDIGKVLKQSGIIKDGLTKIDIAILSALANNEKPMGANYLSQAAGITQHDYEYVYERFLVKRGLIYRLARGRAITKKGKIFLNEIHKGGNSDGHANG